MRPPEAVKRDLVRQWLAKAEEDFGVAEHLIFQESSFFTTVGFHAQQAAEKYLKAFLDWRQIEFPKTHDLDRLLDLVATGENALADLLRDTIILTDYCVEVRYPGDRREISQEEARKAVKLAKKVRDAILESLPDELIEQ